MKTQTTAAVARAHLTAANSMLLTDDETLDDHVWSAELTETALYLSRRGVGWTETVPMPASGGPERSEYCAVAAVELAAILDTYEGDVVPVVAHPYGLLIGGGEISVHGKRHLEILPPPRAEAPPVASVKLVQALETASHGAHRALWAETDGLHVRVSASVADRFLARGLDDPKLTLRAGRWYLTDVALPDDQGLAVWLLGEVDVF